MAEHRTSAEEQASDAREEMRGGRATRGPEYGTGGGPQVPTPPYREEKGAAGDEAGEGTGKAFDADNAPPPGPAPTVSEEEREGLTGTETAPEPPLGVGESHGTGGEELAADRDDVGRKGEADRPVGRAAEDDLDGAGTGRPRDPDAPDLQTGDQGG